MAQRKSAVYQGVEELSEEECLAIARLKTKTADLTVESVTMKPLSDVPTGFMGEHYKVAMTIRTWSNRLEESGDSSELYFFVKTKPRLPLRIEFGENLGAFKRERDFFSKLVVQFRKYAHVPEEDAKHWSPDCYLANDKLIVLDDLSHQDFRLTDGRLGLDFDHCAVLLRTLARFHAASVIFEEKEGQRLGKTVRLDEMYPETLRECVWVREFGNAGRQNCEAAVNAVVSLVTLMSRSGRHPERIEKVLQTLGTLFEEGCRQVETLGEHRNVVCHSDLWANNFMFRYDSKGVPCDGRLIDYQLLRYAAPATDVMTTLYLITRRTTRETHFADLVKEYHATLTEELERHGLDVERIAPWTAFKAGLEQYRWLGILSCFVYYPTILITESLAMEVIADPEMFKKFMLEDQSDVALRCFEGDCLYRARIEEIVEELADYLDDQNTTTTRC